MAEGFWGGLNQHRLYWSGLLFTVGGAVASLWVSKEYGWVAALCEAVADNADLLAAAKDSAFQNKVHLAMQGKGFFDVSEQAK